MLHRIEKLRARGRPILVGTRSVEDSEQVSALLTENGLPHQVLSARQDKGEAEIISQAGKVGCITVATNMAGRGTDIPLGKGVVQLGGLHVIATQRNEARRIDRQLFGRCGRQGDPGSYEMMLSFEDELVIDFYGPRVARSLCRMLAWPLPPVSFLAHAAMRLPQWAMEQRHRRMSRALREAIVSANSYRNQLQKFMAGATDAIAQVAEGIVLDANAAWRELFGLEDGEEVAGTPIMDLFAPESHASLKGALVACMRGRWPGDALRLTGLGQDARPVALEMTLEPSTFDHEPSVRISVAREGGSDGELMLQGQLIEWPAAMGFMTVVLIMGVLLSLHRLVEPMLTVLATALLYFATPGRIVLAMTLYVRAIRDYPLALTVPYLAFTPVLHKVQMAIAMIKRMRMGILS